MNPTVSELDFINLQKKYEDLQLRITRFSKTEQELIHTRNQMDREILIYKQLQEFNTRALKDITDEEFVKLVAESMIGIFELELSIVCIDAPSTGNLHLRYAEGIELTEDQLLQMQAFSESLFRNLPSGTLQNIEFRTSDKIHEILPLQHLVAIQFRDSRLDISVSLLGGISVKGSLFYEPVKKDREAAFYVFCQQVMAQQTNRFKTQMIRNQFSVMSTEQKRISGIAESLIEFDTNPDHNIQKVLTLSQQLFDCNLSMYLRGKQFFFSASARNDDTIVFAENTERACYKILNKEGLDIFCRPMTEKFIQEYSLSWMQAYIGQQFLGSAIRIGKKVEGFLIVLLQESEIVSESLFHSIRILSAAIAVEERRKTALSALSESERKYRTIFEGSPNGIIMADPEIMRFRYVNQTACRMFGYTEVEFINKAVKDLHPAQTLQEVVPVFQDLASSKINYAPDVPCMDSNGRVFYADIYTSLVSFGGKPMLAGFFTDVTQRRNDQQAILKNNQELKKINAELDNFVYSVSHDLRSPLLAIQGIIQLIRLSKQIPAGLEKYLHMIADSATRMDETIKEILEYSRNARLEVRNEIIRFNDLIPQIFNDVKHINTDETELKLRISEQIIFASDRSRVITLLKNLISNAVKYKKKGRNDSFVLVDITVSEEEALIRVEDNGEGIDEEHLDKIFDMFYRASNSAPGTGLGLYICKEILQNINGRIFVESAKGAGTVFILHIKNKAASL